MAALAQGLDVPVVGRHHERNACRLRAAHERGEKPVISPQDRARARIVHRVAGDVRLEELVERQVICAREAKEVLGRTGRRDDRNVGIAVLDRLARQVLKNRVIVHQVVDRRDGFRRRQGHHGRHRLEATGGQLICRIDQIGVRKLHATAASLQFEKEIVGLDDLPEFGSGKAFAMASHRLGAVDAREHRRLAGCGLRGSRNAQACVNGRSVALDQTPKRRTDLRIQRVLRGRRSEADAVDE